MPTSQYRQRRSAPRLTSDVDWVRVLDIWQARSIVLPWAWHWKKSRVKRFNCRDIRDWRWRAFCEWSPRRWSFACDDGGSNQWRGSVPRGIGLSRRAGFRPRVERRAGRFPAFAPARVSLVNCHRLESIAEQNHWSECGRLTSVVDCGAPGRPHRSGPTLHSSHRCHHLSDGA